MATMNSIGSAMPIEAAKGGTGLSTITDHGIMVGSGTGAVTALTVGTNGQLCIGSTGADPVFGTPGSSDSTITWSTGAGTLTAQARAGTEDVTGVVEFATGAETTTGTSTSLAVHPDGLDTRLGTQTQYGLVAGGGGAGNNLAIIAPGTNGQICLGATGAAAAFATPGSSDSTITWTTGANTLTAQCRAGTESDTGVVELATGAETTTGTSTTLAVHPDGLDTRLGTQTDHGVMLGGGGAGNNLGVTAEGAAGKLLRGAGASDPTWSTFTIPDTFAQGDLLLASSANTITAITKDASSTRYLSNTGADNNAAWAQIALTTGVTGILPVTNGGTGVADPTDHSLYVGSGASAMTALGSATDGQIPIGSTGADPVLAAISAGSGISVTNAAGSITIAATGSGMGYEEVTGTTKQAAVDVVYTCNNEALVTVTLPDTAAAGSTIGIIGKGVGGWKVGQNAGETIKFGTATSTEGVEGYIASTNANDVVYLVCITEDVLWSVVQSVGNITIV